MHALSYRRNPNATNRDRSGLIVKYHSRANRSWMSRSGTNARQRRGHRARRRPLDGPRRRRRHACLRGSWNATRRWCWARSAHMLGHNSDVEDIAQQVFLRVWKSARRYEPRAKFTTWLLKITRNLVFNELRRRKRQALIPLQNEMEGDEIQLKDEQVITPDASPSRRRIAAGNRIGHWRAARYATHGPGAKALPGA